MKALFRVLLVEDDIDTARLVRRRLERSPRARFQVTHAPDLQLAFGLLEKEPFDAILLDLSLPDGDMMSTLAAMGAVARHVPVVVLTGHSDEDLALLAIRAGAQDYLMKDEQNARTVVRSLLHAIERKRRAAAGWEAVA